jgi:hypothetical protein
MLEITNRQFNELSIVPRDALIVRLAAFIRDHGRSDFDTISDNSLCEYIRESYSSAVQNGARSERAIAMWLCLQIMGGPSFHTIPAVAKFLENSRHVDEGLRQLFSRLSLLELRRSKL